MKLNKKRAFTLAEVLITLGVTGVLILLLVSSFRANSMTAWHKSNDYKTGIVKYDKVYNALNLSFTNQALKNAGFFKENKETVLNTALDSLNSTCSGSGCKFTGVSETTNSFRRQLADGTQLSVKVFADNNGSDGGLSDLSYIIYVDTNGDAKPNKIGQDRLPIYIDKNGNVLNVNPKTGKSYIAEAQKKYDGKSYHIPCPSDYEGEIIATKDAKTGLYNYDKTNCTPIVKDCTEEKAKKDFKNKLTAQGVNSINESLINTTKSDNTYTLKYKTDDKSYMAKYTLSEVNACVANLVVRDECSPNGKIIEVSTVDDFDYIREHLNCNYKLMNDIDLCSNSQNCIGEGWEPIAVSSTPEEYGINGNSFSGTFDGDNHKITNLYINRPKTSYIGLFGYVTGNIKNLTVIPKTQNSISGPLSFGYPYTLKYSIHGFNFVGTLAGLAINAKISNCHAVNTSIYGGEKISNPPPTYNGGYYTGGLIGSVGGHQYANPGRTEIEKCSANGYVYGELYNGGLLGFANNLSINKSYFTGTVFRAQGSGGFIGDAIYVDINECYSNANVHAMANNHDGRTNVGGFLAWASYTNINNSYAKGSVVGRTCVGGLIGQAASGFNGKTYGRTINVTNSYITMGNPFFGCGDGISTFSSSYGLNTNYYSAYTKTLEEMKKASTYADWDTNIWDIKDGDYPKLKRVPEN